ncbi:hypothetical protein [Rhodococcus opacus]|uniref:Transposase n=1 Tax=Rhodococcus opacus TaxID=37919 RepID=A0A1B1KCQ5_RHOOP|nr:hypothetical protein [Rhodococcus opacus]ANS30382.1 hypothetical protein R1CP_28735 [Rhodococcus opacus]UNM99841.1 hypothetical protein MOO23_29925 [Rhodococcus opacus]
MCEVDETMRQRRVELEGSDQVTGGIPGSGFGPRHPDPWDLIVGLIAQLRRQSFAQIVVRVSGRWSR